jgi:hypothetical protein
MTRAWLLSAVAGLVGLSLAHGANGAVPRVEIVGEPGAWQLLRDGQPFFVKGAGGDGDYHRLVRIGGNTIRTYSSVRVEDPLRRARGAGLAVMFGLWIGHERHGFSYADEAAVERQRRMVIEAVKTHRDNPDIIMWAVGNEMEGDGSNPALWREINHLARLVKELDSRPVLTVLAGAAPQKLDAVRHYCPDLDLLGINAYGGLPGVRDRMLKHLPDMPYMITEFGARGHWESPKTPWGVEYEQTSSEKAAMILSGWQDHIAGNAGRCLGGFVFRWGWKQEATHTWFALLERDGSPTAGVDALERAWTGRWPSKRAPEIEPLALPTLAEPLKPGQRVPLNVVARPMSQSQLRYRWAVYEESRDRKSGGDAEASPPEVAGAIESADRPNARLRAPGPGRYRVFVTVRDSEGRVATANQPFVVK